MTGGKRRKKPSMESFELKVQLVAHPVGVTKGTCVWRHIIAKKDGTKQSSIEMTEQALQHVRRRKTRSIRRLRTLCR